MKFIKFCCCFAVIICVCLVCAVPSFAYSSSQPSYDVLNYVPKYIFDATAFVGYSTLPGDNAEKANINVPGFNVGLPSYQQNRFEVLDSYFDGAPYGVKYSVYNRPGTDSNGVTNVSMVTLSNSRWNTVGSEFDPSIFGNAYEYILSTTPGVIYGFGDTDIAYTFSDTIEFIFLIPRNTSVDEYDEFDVTSYVDLSLRVSYGNYTIDADYGLLRSTKNVVYDDSVINSYDWLEIYGENYIDGAPLYDSTPLSQVYGLCHVLFYPGRYLMEAMDDIYNSDIVSKNGLLFSDFTIDCKMNIDSTAVDFSYVNDGNNGEGVANSYTRFLDNTGYVPIYSCSSYCNNINSVQNREFISSVLGTAGRIDSAVIDPNTDFDFVSWIGSTVFGVLQVEFIPGVSIANILYVIVGLGVLFLIIKYFAGG